MTQIKPEVDTAVAVGGDDSSPAAESAPASPVEVRSSNVAGVNYKQRLIDVVAVPYDEVGRVEYRGELWQERFLRGAFDGLEKRSGRVKANREHDRFRLVGKVVNFYPSRQEGLVASVRISKTPLGDETLALCDDEVLGASIGFAVRGSDQDLDRRTRMRTIKRAFVDHVAFDADPVYAGAGVLSVRSAASEAVADLQPLVTPALDELNAWLQARKR